MVMSTANEKLHSKSLGNDHCKNKWLLLASYLSFATSKFLACGRKCFEELKFLHKAKIRGTRCQIQRYSHGLRESAGLHTQNLKRSTQHRCSERLLSFSPFRAVEHFAHHHNIIYGRYCFFKS